ncbi:hypothetical protein Q31b_19560 [Novipirellula aureliae]|uniref:Uncharacterized protein n=1 Tax=Novipirellula aureliae TaxID=2527966 RepID=A0A5C6E6K0_9BACT|nr:hypothetical protein [Novipirellula aureliae]TWU44420.1 hypothetical protein Q31b_19560 [Novipirellula aureliae]
MLTMTKEFPRHGTESTRDDAIEVAGILESFGTGIAQGLSSEQPAGVRSESSSELELKQKLDVSPR